MTTSGLCYLSFQGERNNEIAKHVTSDEINSKWSARICNLNL